VSTEIKVEGKAYSDSYVTRVTSEETLRYQMLILQELRKHTELLEIIAHTKPYYEYGKSGDEIFLEKCKVISE
jgi:hypothetical protein